VTAAASSAADLAGSELAGGDLAGADLAGADLASAELATAKLAGSAQTSRKPLERPATASGAHGTKQGRWYAWGAPKAQSLAQAQAQAVTLNHTQIHTPGPVQAPGYPGCTQGQ